MKYSLQARANNSGRTDGNNITIQTGSSMSGTIGMRRQSRKAITGVTYIEPENVLISVTPK
jgi:hypothetical protein